MSLLGYIEFIVVFCIGSDWLEEIVVEVDIVVEVYMFNVYRSELKYLVNGLKGFFCCVIGIRLIMVVVCKCL